VNPLAHFLDRHPIWIGAVGSTAGLGSKLAEQLHIIAGIAADIGFIFGAATAVLSFAILVIKLITKRRRHEWQRRLHHEQDIDGHE
jgi:hypothetical protein